jgi:hypothetical protein
MVLPVLVDGAQMPQPQQLPEDIRAIATINGLPLRHESFDDDAEKIVATILGTSAKQRLWDDQGRLIVKIGYAIAGLVAALVVLASGAMVHLWWLARPLSASIGDAATTLLLIAGAVLGAWTGLIYEAANRKRRLQGLV